MAVGANVQVSIIDYGLGNLGSVLNMFRRVEVDAELVSSAEAVLAAERLLLPGVGAFDHGVRGLYDSGLDTAIRTAAAAGTPILGICLGMQMLTNASAEGTLPGLGLIDAHCERFAFDAPGLRVPHMGWNQISLVQDHPVVSDVPHRPKFYFAHSFRVMCRSVDNVLARTHYGGEFASMIFSDNLVGAQFHPEKSHVFGMRLFEGFARWRP